MGTRRRRHLLFAAVLVPIVAALAGGSAYLSRAAEEATLSRAVVAESPSSAPPVVPSAAAAPVPHLTGTPSAGRSTVRDAGAGVRYEFDGGLGSVLDRAGRLPLTPREAAGGHLASVPHGGGLAVRFPPPCAHYGSDRCERAILRSGPAGFLNPGSAPFRYGASLLVQPNETSKGANVLQKGYSVGDSQFKLQVDGAAGKPSCVLVGTGSSTIYVATASTTVADGQWHRVECTRRDSLLTLAVDGRTRGRTSIPPSLSIVNTDPLCIGGKGTSPNNDQFSGVVDDVFVSKES